MIIILMIIIIPFFYIAHYFISHYSMHFTIDEICTIFVSIILKDNHAATISVLVQ